MLAAFIMYTTKRLGVEVFKGWGKGGAPFDNGLH